MPSITTTDGTRIHYSDSGGEGPPLLFVHGWCGRLEHWEPQARAFRRSHRVVRLDLRGHGRSSAPHSAYSREEFAGDVAELIRALDLRDVTIVGHSMGGPIVLDAAWLEPERVRAFVIVDSDIIRSVVQGAPDTHPWMRAIADDYEQQIPRHLLFSLGLWKGHHPALRERIARDALRTPVHVGLGAMRHAILGSATRPEWSALDMPALYVNSSRSAFDEPALCTVLPKAEFAQAVGSGHWVQLEVPDQFNAMLRNFLERLPARRG